MKYVYPAIFTEEVNGLYSVNFPDLEGCYTGGQDFPDALDMAKDVLCFCLYDLENEKAKIPAPSKLKDIKAGQNEFIQLVACDTEFYRKFYKGQAVKKTLTIPLYLNEMAEKDGVNFSAVLQEALKVRLGVK